MGELMRRKQEARFHQDRALIQRSRWIRSGNTGRERPGEEFTQKALRQICITAEMMGADRQSKVELMLKQLQKELRWIQKQRSLIANGRNGPVRTNEKVKVERYT
ncbi:hypothetical protein AMELA_G00285390 [Ameiurus melas]|uniref:Uncharacterized protein n=1 Tax=Ameiurus melas TaxID=219545 RepID=A0A7J5ZKW3_AMEME|nr:hypothetical protein AMELA_G00285390 [Ameiurus melas]